MNDYKLVKYDNNGVSIDVRFDLDNNTIWLTQNEIAILFNKTKSNISILIKNIINEKEQSVFSSGEITESNVKYHLTTELLSSDGKTYKTKLYNLDMIEAISKRSKSNSGVEFIKWVKDALFDAQSQNVLNFSPYKALNYDVVVFEDGEVKLDITISPKEETVWLTQETIASLFNITIPNISMHIKNIFDENEIEKESVVKKFLITASDGKNYYVTHYNFDMVLAIGYRINGKRGIAFRKWATRVLKEYSIRGYTINYLNNKKCIKIMAI